MYKHTMLVTGLALIVVNLYGIIIAALYSPVSSVIIIISLLTTALVVLI